MYGKYHTDHPQHAENCQRGQSTWNSGIGQNVSEVAHALDFITGTGAGLGAFDLSDSSHVETGADCFGRLLLGRFRQNIGQCLRSHNTALLTGYLWYKGLYQGGLRADETGVLRGAQTRSSI